MTRKGCYLILWAVGLIGCLQLLTACSLRTPINTGSSMTILQPIARGIYQIKGGSSNFAEVPVEGKFSSFWQVSQVQARYYLPGTLAATPWQIIDDRPAHGYFKGAMIIKAGGWYSIDVRLLVGGFQIFQSTVQRVGAGLVFITAGQSNACNYGEVKQKADDRVSAWTGTRWVLANDPQPLGCGTDGSVWPLVGNLLVHQYNVPIGFCSVGVGSTRIEQWLPFKPYHHSKPFDLSNPYLRIKSALQDFGPYGVDGILWDQGESDVSNATPGPVYTAQLSDIIKQSRIDAGYAVNWDIAIVSYTYGPKVTRETRSAIKNAQLQVLKVVPGTFIGPNTDDLQGPTYRRRPGNYIHFNALGQQKLAGMWLTSLQTLVHTTVGL